MNVHGEGVVVDAVQLIGDGARCISGARQFSTVVHFGETEVGAQSAEGDFPVGQGVRRRIGAVMGGYRRAASLCASLPSFDPCLAVQDVLEGAITIEDIEVVLKTSPVGRSRIGPPFAGGDSAAHTHVAQVPCAFNVAT